MNNLNSNPLKNSIQFIKGIGPKKAEILKKLEIYTVFDLLTYFPKGFIKLDLVEDIQNLDDLNQPIFIKIKIIEKNYINIKRGIFYIKGLNGERIIKLVFFNRAFYFDKFQNGEEIFVYGKFKKEFFANNFTSSNFRLIPKYFFEEYKLLPYYNLTKDLNLFNLINFIENAYKDYEKYIEEILPDYIIKKYNLPPFKKVIYKLHFPKSIKEYNKAKEIYAYIEFFLYMLQIYLQKKLNVKVKVKRKKIDFNYQKEFIKSLDFELTNDQLKVISELNNDYSNENLINRLIQGDVGSGKTVVSFAFAMNYIESNDQIAFMAPTEILAMQHYNNFKKIIERFKLRKINFEILTSSLKSRERNIILDKLKNGEIDVIFGTHALIQKDIEFKNLKLVIIDEQQKFGVHQRLELRNKGKDVDLIVLTATPIPRTYNLTLYGDLDISIIKEKPSSRKKVKTILFKKSDYSDIIDLIKNDLKNGGKGFFIYPVIEEDNLLELDSAKENFEIIKSKFEQYNVELIHGKMKDEEIKKIVEDFKRGKINILVSTTIVGVGIDVPDATFIVIEEAQRFGLSTLHQLRGRIGRGDKEGLCVLVYANNISKIAFKRLKKIEESDDGFEISEFDLKLRGPGEVFGERQSGKLEFKIADIIENSNLLKIAAADAKEIIEKYPDLNYFDLKNLKNFLVEFQNLNPIYLLSG
jgi:ATP-dependent DNA helicase RecG